MNLSQKNNKASVPIIAITLLLIVSVSGVFYFEDWFREYEEDFKLKISSKTLSNSFEIIKVDGVDIYVKNDFKDDLKIFGVKINNIDCFDKNLTIDKGIAKLDVGDCSIGLDPNRIHEVSVITNWGIKSEEEPIRNVILGPFIVKFTFDVCDFALGYVRAFGLTGLDGGHGDVDTSSTYNLCLKHLNYNLGTSSSGNFVNLFYLTEQNNSAVWTNQSSIYQSPASWFNVSVSSSGGTISYVVNSSDMSSIGYTCVGKIDEDNVYGSHIGDCSSSLPDTLWLKIN